MQAADLNSRVTGYPQVVNTPGETDPPSSADSMIHHKDPIRRSKIIMSLNMKNGRSHYGVSPTNRGLTISVLHKRHDRIRELLAGELGLTECQRECVFRLLRLWAYYGKVYPKSDQVAELPGCSRATFFRTVRILEDRGLVRVVNRYLVRARAQISNLYLLHNLILLICRYLSEHGAMVAGSWIRRYLVMPGSMFWGLFRVGGLDLILGSSP